AAAGQAPRPLSNPNRHEIGVGPAAIPDADLTSTARARALAAFSGYWGGTYTTSTGESVTIFSSPSYAADQTRNQRSADFPAPLVRGSELSTTTVYIAPPAEVQQTCGGADVVGCYGQNTIVIPDEDTQDISVEAVLTHEYGHHVADSRDNAPWPAVNWGTKRW